MKSYIYDLYSGLGFYQALAPIGPTAAGVVPGTNGVTIDLQGFNACTFMVNVGSTRFAAASALHLALQHGLASAAGVSAWSFVPNSLLIHSVEGGYNATSEDGIFKSLASDDGGAIYFVGYKGDNTHRYVRLYVSGDAGVGSMCAGAVAILGPSTWPVNSPVNV
jgi:hypothetical protein